MSWPCLRSRTGTSRHLFFCQFSQMETILENIIGAIEAVWFKLATLLNLEEVATFDSLKPILANILADPLLLGLTLAILTIIPYTIHKIKSAYTEKEKRLDALLRELDDEDSEENDTSKPLFQNQSIKSSSFDQPTEESDDEEYGNEFESPSSQKKTITSGDLNQTPQEIFKNRRISDADFGWESGDDEWGELYDYISKPFQEDKSAAVSSGNEALPESKEELPTEPAPKEEVTAGIDQSIEQTTGESSNIGIDELAELIEEEETVLDINRTNEALTPKEEITAGIGGATEETAEESSNIDIDELAELIEEELDVPVAKVSTADSPGPETVASPPIRQRVELTLEEVEPELESKPALQTLTIESPEPETGTPSTGLLLNSMLDSSVSAKTDALVSRLKTFQAELETRFQSLEKETETPAETTPTETLRKKQGNYQPAKVSYQSKRKSRSNKEYLRQLESFIFMARQKSKSTDV